MRITALTVGLLLLVAPAGATGRHEHRLPHALVLLEQKMQDLQIHSERWEEVFRLGPAGKSSGGRCEQGNCRSASRAAITQGARLIGLFGEDPPEAEFFRAGEEGRSGYILSGSNLYAWVPSECAPGRPWITEPLPAGAASPVGGPLAADRDPRRPYGALIATLAASKVVELGPRTVAGQPVTAFLAIRSVPANTPPVGFVAAKGAPRVDERLEVFINAEGVPSRVVAKKSSPREGSIVVVTNVLAVNLPQPLGIQAPPAEQTRPASKESCASEGSTK